MCIRESSAALLAAGLMAASMGTMGVRAQGTFDLSGLDGTNGFVMRGFQTNANSGYSASGAGDVNGDGLADVIVGAPDTSPGGRTRAGEAYVIFSQTGSLVELDNVGAAGFVISGAANDDNLGHSVASAGDVNGDGLADVIVGAPEADPGAISRAGQVYIVFGKADTTAVDPSSLGSGGFAINGTTVNEQAGIAVSGAGDVNGDGLNDVIIGTRSNKAYVVFGQAGSTDIDLSALNGTNGYRLDSDGAGYDFGQSVSGAGDVNGDGLADLVIGARNAQPDGELFQGKAYVFFGQSGTAVIPATGLNGSNGFYMDGIGAIDYAGRSVSGAGDVNGDGFADVIVGADQAGEAYVVFGQTSSATIKLANLDGTNGFAIEGSGSTGWDVGGAGDVNGDGLADVVVGNISSEAYVVFGGVSAASVDGDSLDGTDGFIINQASSGQLGRAVSGAGDVDGDGLSDIILGAPFVDDGGTINVGETYVVYGPVTGVTTDTNATYTVGLAAGELNEIPIGVTGDGSDANSPAAQAFIDFNGAGGTAGTVDVQLTRNQLGLPASFTDPDTADVYWEITTTRTGWTDADVTLKYTDDQIAGLDEANLIVYQNDDLTGAWTEITPTIDQAMNELNFNVTGFSYFALGDVTGLPVELDGFLVE